MGVELELAVLLFISVLGQCIFARFELETPIWRRVLKWFVVIAITVALYYAVGHRAIILPVALMTLGLSVHFVWCRRHGIDPIRATPTAKYYALRGWTWPPHDGN